MRCHNAAMERSTMYINKEDYHIHYNNALVENVVDVDVQECQRLAAPGLEECRDVLVVTFLGPAGKLLRIKDSAEAFKFEKNASTQARN